jgi:hypothetical protein
LPYKDRKHPERYDRAFVEEDEMDDYNAMGADEQFKGKKATGKYRPTIFEKKIGLSSEQLDKLKGLSKEEQVRRMRELAH